MLLEKLRKDMIQAKKDKDYVKGTLLSTVVAEAVMVGKNDGNRESTEEEVIKTIKKFIKNIDEAISIMSSSGKDFEKEKTEKSILESYLPKQLSNDELSAAIDAIIATLPEKSPKMMGTVMNELKAKYNGLYDGKAASELTKSKLA